MVGSNTSSGLGRSVLCESLESRQFFSVATPDTAFKGGETVIRFGGTSEEATAGTVLANGRLFVAGVSYQKTGSQIVAAVLNSDGSLYKSFDGDGKMTLSTAARDALGSVQQVLALPDGGALLVGSGSIVKVLAKGGVDATFGTHGNGIVEGFLPNDGDGYAPYIYDARVESNGTIRLLYSYQTSDGVRVATFDSKGKKATLTFKSLTDNVEVTLPQFLPDGTIAAVINGNDQKYRLVRYDTALKPIFPAAAGSIDLSAALTKFFTTHKISSDTAHQPTTNIPYLTGGKILLGAHGKISWIAVFNGSASGIPTTEDAYHTTQTRISVAIGLDGKTIDVYGGGATGSGASEPVFEGAARTDAPAGVNGHFYTTVGTGIDVSVLKGKAVLDGAALDVDGSVYLFGRATADQGFAVASVLPPTGAVTGVLFNDDNANEIRDDDETVNPGRVVFLDTNNNNVLDEGEYSTLTNYDGRYYIGGLPAGDYKVRRVLPTGYQVTTTNIRYNFATTVTAGRNTEQAIGSIKAGIVQGILYEGDIATGTRLAGRQVFLDLDRDGKYDSNEPSAVTDSSGFYRLITKTAGTYRVTTATPAGLKPSGYPSGYATVYLGTTTLTNASFSFKKA